LLSKKKKDFRDWRWVILVLSAEVLWEGDCLFFPENAAKRDSRLQSDEHLCGPDALARCFGDEPLRTRLGLPTFFPTNQQAETIARTDLSTAYVQAVVLDLWDPRVAGEIRSCFRDVEVMPPNQPTRPGRWESLFRYRRDWEHWRPAGAGDEPSIPGQVLRG
jgi:hypothetical protein